MLSLETRDLSFFTIKLSVPGSATVAVYVPDGSNKDKYFVSV